MIKEKQYLKKRKRKEEKPQIHAKRAINERHSLQQKKWTL